MAKCCDNIAASLKHRVTVQSPVRTSDGQGGYVEIWTYVAEVWAAIEPVKAYEKFQAMQMQLPISHRVVIRYRDGIDATMRLQWGDRILDLKEVINVGELSRFLNIKAIERA